MTCIFNSEEFIYGTVLRIVLVFVILTNAPLISEPLLDSILVTMAILQRCLGATSSYTTTVSLTLLLWEFIFNFDVCSVSRKFTTIFMSPLIPKMITDVVYLINRCCVRRI